MPARAVGQLLLSLCALLLPACSEQAGPPAATEPAPAEALFLWKVEGGELAGTSWLFGTMHVPDPRVLAHLDALEPVLREVDVLVTELPDDPAGQQRLLDAASLHGETLEDVLPSAVHRKLEDFLRSEGLSLEPYRSFEPAWVTAQLAQLDLRELPRGPALDVRLQERAARLGIEVRGVETHLEQFASLTVGDRTDHVHLLDKALDQLVEDRARGINRTAELLELYLSGDAERMERFAESELDPQDPVEMRAWVALHAERNLRMGGRVLRMLEEEPEKRFLFAFGALHFLGDRNLVALLREAGYTVTRAGTYPGS